MKILLLLVAGSVINLSTCKEDRGTSRSPDLISREELMTGKVWQVDELIHNVDGENSHYIRGGMNTTRVNYDNMRFTFDKGGAGTHTDQYGKTHKTSWKFNKSDNKTIHLSVHLSTDIDFTWRMVEVSEKSIYATTAISQYGADDILESFRLTPRN